MRGLEAPSTTSSSVRVPEPRAGGEAAAATGGRTVDDQLRRLEARLLAEVGEDPDRERTVRGHLAQARARFASATVRQFLPILIEREVRRLLAAR
jgi:hypothetical protein